VKSGTLARAVWIVMVILGPLAALELGLRYAAGLGQPVLYDNTYAYGYRPLPDQERARGARKRIRINNHGLRATRDWPAAPDTTQVRLLYLGDSVTYGGSWIDDRETFAELSASELARRSGRDVLVGNAGVNGWGPLNILGLVQHDGFWNSDLVVVVAQEVDFERTLSHVAETPFWNRRPSLAIEELLSSHVAYSFGLRRYLPKEHFVSPVEMDSLYVSNLVAFLEVGRRARATGGRVLMAWHPSRAAALGAAEPNRARFLDAARREGFPVLDLDAPVRNASEPAKLFMDPLHLSVAGHALYGRAFAEALAALATSSP
jgi:hypothetical protein